MGVKKTVGKKPRGMKYFAYLCTVNAVLGLIFSFFLGVANIGFIGMYPRQAALAVLGAVGFFVCFAFYIARLVCYSRYKQYGVYPRWMLYAMSMTLWYGWVYLITMCIVTNATSPHTMGAVIAFYACLYFVPVPNQVYLIRRRHLFVFDKSKLVYGGSAVAQTPSTERTQPMPQMPPCVQQIDAPAPPAPVQEQGEVDLAPVQVVQEGNTTEIWEEMDMAWIGKRVKSKFLGFGIVIVEEPGKILVDFGHKQQAFAIPQAFQRGI